jgi:hypothetical protein
MAEKPDDYKTIAAKNAATILGRAPEMNWPI